MKRVNDVICVFRIHLARLRAEAGPFLLAALIFPSAMYLFTNAISGAAVEQQTRLRFLAGSIVFSLSLTAISWLGYLLLENRFTGRLKLFATLPLAPSSYVFGIVIFGLIQAALGTGMLLLITRLLGVRTHVSIAPLAATILLTMLCLCGLAVIIASRARSFSEGSLLTDSLGAGLVFVAPVYYSPETMPHALRLISEWLPTALAAHAVQAALAGSYAISKDLAVLGAMAILSLSVGFKLMRFREE
ncbi:MAG TPA: ABC transporter permease [Pyrinomonadaceae bacterium]|nr:ABC transporter permease [Pyrinomonadaceae bacterium]